MKKIGLMLLIIVFSILVIPLIIMEGAGPGLRANGENSGGVTDFIFEEKGQNTEVVTDYSDNGPRIKVYNVVKSQTQEVPIEEYVLEVLCAEMPAEFGDEALKAQAIVSRTYAVTKMRIYGGTGCRTHPEADICTDSHCCQAWMPKEERLSNWDEKSAAEYWNRIKRAVDETRGMILTYNAAPVMYPMFFSTSSGRTENSQDIFVSAYPYLTSVPSPNEESAPDFSSQLTITGDDFVKKFAECKYNIKLDKTKLSSQVKILSRSEGGSVLSIQIGSKTLKGTEVRSILSLNSANFKMDFNNSDVVITVLGNGHGVGMSQWGANAMSESGKKYDEILKHYYQGVEIGLMNEIYNMK